MKNEQDDFYARLIDALTNEVHHDSISQSRHALMALVAEGYGQDCTSVLLWLRDEEKNVPILRLSSVHDRQRCLTRPDELLNISTSWDETSFPQISDEINNRIFSWHKEIHGCQYQACRVLKLDHPGKNDGEADKSCFGYIQLLIKTESPRDITGHLTAAKAFAAQILTGRDQDIKNISAHCVTAAKALATRIYTDRNVRLMKVAHSLQEKLWDERNPMLLLDKAASVLTKFTRARMCVIYRPTRATEGRQLGVDGKSADEDVHLPDDWDGFALTSNSPTAHIFDQGRTIRINDIGDPDEFKELFPDFKGEVDKDVLVKFDTLLAPVCRQEKAKRSRIYASVRVPTVGGGKTPVALIKVLSKNGSLYLHDRFSLADEEILAVVGRHLASILPGIETMAAIKSISDALAKAPLDEPGEQAQISIAKILLDKLKEWVNGVETVSFVFDQLSSASTYPDLDDWGADMSNRKVSKLGKIIKIPGKERWCYATNPSGNTDGKRGRLLVGLKTGELPLYQAEIIDIAATAVWLAAYEVAAYDHAIKYLIETRHAIRSGVQGMIGPISSALENYRVVAEFNDPELTHRELIRGAAFRKALETAYLSARETQGLLDEARLTYTNIQHASLQIHELNLLALLKDVIRIARPEADLRKLKIDLDNRISSSQEMALFDRKAMRIVFHNLLDNAIKYAARNTAIVVRAWVEQRFWYVAIEDMGVYIEPNDYEIIFQLFTRVTTHDPVAHDCISSRPGTGFGLAISRKIVRAHSKKAELSVDSIRPSGAPTRARTTFTIKMPRRLDEGAL